MLHRGHRGLEHKDQTGLWSSSLSSSFFSAVCFPLIPPVKGYCSPRPSAGEISSVPATDGERVSPCKGSLLPMSDYVGHRSMADGTER